MSATRRCLFTSPLLGLIIFNTCVCFGQTDTLALSSGVAALDGSVTLNLALTSPAGNQPAALEWTFAYPAANVVLIAAVPGPAAVAAGKLVSCSSGTGTLTCVAYGVNSTTISNGTVAIVSLVVAAGPVSTSIGIT